MIDIQGGVPVVAGRRFPWAYQVLEDPNDSGSRSFTLKMENGWTIWVYFNDAGEVGAHAYTALGGYRDFFATDDAPKHFSDAGYPRDWSEWQAIILTPAECLRFIDRVASLPSHPA